MNKYIGENRLTYLWGKIKAFVSNAISGKVDKVSSPTDNAVVRFDGTSGNIQNSGVTINDSNHLTAAKFITSGGTNSQVVLGDGTLTAADTLPQYEAYLKWGGKNISGGYAPIDASMIGELGANRLAFPNAGGITVEYSRDSGTTWTDYQASDDKKVGLFSGIQQKFAIGKAASNDVASNTYQLRIKIVAGSGSSAVGVYTQLNKFAFLVSTSGSTNCWCTIKGRKTEDYNDNTETYKTYADQVAISGWSGYNIINTSSITFGTSNTQTKEIIFTFGCGGYNGNGTTNTGLQIYKVFGFGGVGWSTPSNMAKNGHLYSYDSSQNAIFPANITAPKFITTDGTSSQFVKGDGSLDSTSYATESYVDDAIADKADSATTLAGYGITDAKIENGVITLGSNSVTPITSHQDISSKADKSEMSVVAGTGANADKTTITLKSGTSATVLTSHQDVSGKADKDELLPEAIDYSKQYLRTTALESGTISFNIWYSMGTDLITSISYSTDNGATWTTINNQDDKSENLVITVNVNAGDKVLWKGTAQQIGYIIGVSNNYGFSFFSSTAEFNVDGNIMSLCYGDNFVGQVTLNYQYQFASLFSDYNEVLSTLVVDANHLILPATELTQNCYSSMFYGCTSLTTAPELPATTLANHCYEYMFGGCTSLTNAPMLPATTLVDYCYSHMFDGCTSLTSAPELPATTLANHCYEYMFDGCSNLNYIKALFTTTPSGSRPHFYTSNWVSGVAATGTFVKNDSAAWTTTGDNAVPTGWTTRTESEMEHVRQYQLNDRLASLEARIAALEGG